MRRQTPGSIAGRSLFIYDGIRMKTKIIYEEMTVEDIEEAAEALAAIIVRHLSVNRVLTNKEGMNNSNRNSITHNNETIEQ